MGTSPVLWESSATGDVDTPGCVVPLQEAVAAAEAVRDSGGHALLVLDTIRPMTSAWNLGVSWAQHARGEHLDPDLLGVQRRRFFSNLTERSASLKTGGSLTLLAVVESNALAALGTPASGIDNERIYTLTDIVGCKQADLERVRRVMDRGIPLSGSTLTSMGIAPPAAAGDATKEAVTLNAESIVSRELQSLSDGQLVFSEAAAAAGMHPALVPGATFSRFGLGSSRPSTGTKPTRDIRPPALQAVAAHLRTELALEETARFRPSSAGADTGHSARMMSVKSALLQPLQARLGHEEMTVLLLAASSGAFDGVPPALAADALRGGAEAPLLKHLHAACPVVLQNIANGSYTTGCLRNLDVAVRLFAALLKSGVSE